MWRTLVLALLFALGLAQPPPGGLDQPENVPRQAAADAQRAVGERRKLTGPGMIKQPTAPPEPKGKPAPGPPGLTGPPRRIEALPVPAAALALCVADARTLPEPDRHYMRYLWLPSADVDDARAVSLAVNIPSRSDAIARPLPLGKGRLMVLRIDLRDHASTEADLGAWIEAWEELQYDPYFSLIVTRDTLSFVARAFPDHTATGHVTRMRKEVVTVPRYLHTDGYWYTKKWAERLSARIETVRLADLARMRSSSRMLEDSHPAANLEDVELVRLPAPHLDLIQHAALCQLTRSQAPLVTAPYACLRMLTQIQDRGLYQVLYGGLYYRFAGVRQSAAKKRTDEEQWLRDLGVRDRADYERLRSDQRAAIFRSAVSGRPRLMEFFRTPSGRIDLTTGFTAITRDLRRQDIDIGRHPVYNLLKFEHAASAAIWERPNGLHGYALFNGQGVRQDVVPPDIARDTTIPSPHSVDLEPALSCIACHEAQGSDGWRTVTNDVKRMLSGKGIDRVELLGDVSGGRLNYDDQRRILTLYAGEPERTALPRARNDYARAVLEATGPFKASKTAQTDVVKLAGRQLVSLVRGYRYEMLDPGRALASLGV